MPLPPMTRASALRGGLITLGAAVVGFVVARAGDLGEGSGTGAANAYGTAPTGGSPLAAVDDIPAGGGLVLGEGEEVHAFSSTCTHQGCPVSEVTGGRILCPCHGSAFDAETGEVVQGPATAALPEVDVTVEDGEVLSG